MIDLNRIHSLTDFLRNHKTYVERLKTSEAPDVLTINGSPELVIQSATAYQELLDRLAFAENVAGVKAAYAEVREGKGKPYDEEMKALRKRRGI